MTIKELASDLYRASVNGHFNGERFTKAELTDYIASMFRPGTRLKNDRLTMTITLPDGEWYFTIWDPRKTSDGFLWYIPETREQEQHIINDLLS